LQLCFRHWLPWDLQSIWQHIQSLAREVVFQEDNDVISWKSNKNVSFTVKSVYDALTSNETGNNYRMLWKGRIPAKNQNLLMAAEK
jgi:hypothetical protein